MKFKEIETVDLLEDTAIYWVALSDIPETVQQKAMEADGKEYDVQGFGIDVGYDLIKKEFFIFTNEDPATGSGNIFYVDKDGNRCWFQVEIGDELTKRIFNACDRINACVDTPQGYTIQKTVQFERGFGLVLAKKDDPIYPFASWEFKETPQGCRDYISSHYYADERTAEKAFANAIDAHTQRERIYYSPTAKVTAWGAGKKPSIREQLAAAKPVPSDKPITKPKEREVR